MSESKHTPGPWIIGFATGRIMSGEKDGNFEIARMRATCATERWDADAYLIAAAPDLLQACKRMIQWYVEGGGWCKSKQADCPCEQHAALRAIAKAEGRNA